MGRFIMVRPAPQAASTRAERSLLPASTKSNSTTSPKQTLYKHIGKLDSNTWPEQVSCLVLYCVPHR